MITKVIVLAAGTGTRLLPATKTIEKPLLPIGNKPLIQLIVEQLVASGITDIVFVVNPDSQVKKHFDQSDKLEHVLKSHGKEKLLEEVRKLPTLANFHYAVQEKPMGSGDALLAAAPYLAENETAVLLYCDIFFKSPVPVPKQLIDAYKEPGSILLAVGPFYPQEKISHYGVLQTKPIGNKMHAVKHYLEKPEKWEGGTPLSPCGYGVITSEVFPYLKQLTPSKRGEIEFPDAINLMIADGKPVYGYEVEGTLFDCGSVEGYKKLFCELA